MHDPILFLFCYFHFCYLCRCCILTGLDLRHTYIHTHTHIIHRSHWNCLCQFSEEKCATIWDNGGSLEKCVSDFKLHVLFLSHFFCVFLSTFNLVCTLYIKSAKWVEPLVKFVVYAWICACVEFYTAYYTLIYSNTVAPTKKF